MTYLNLLNFNNKNKKGIEFHEVGLWILALVALAIIIWGLIMMKEKGINILEGLKELLRFGR